MSKGTYQGIYRKIVFFMAGIICISVFECWQLSMGCALGWKIDYELVIL